MYDVYLIVRESVKFFCMSVRSLLLLPFGPRPIFFWNLSIVWRSFVIHNISGDVFLWLVVIVLLHLLLLLFYLWYEWRRLPSKPRAFKYWVITASFRK